MIKKPEQPSGWPFRRVACPLWVTQQQVSAVSAVAPKAEKREHDWIFEVYLAKTSHGSLQKP
jgi:hypothetical protein